MFQSASAALASRRDELRREWNLEPSQAVFLFAGKFVDKKRPADFVRAIAQSNGSNSQVVGLMVGDGPLRLECEQLARDLNAPVRFAGFLNQSAIVKSFVAADALVLPSDGGETWGLVVNEAMSCGRAAIVSDHVGCAPDLIANARTGFVFRLGDIDDLSDRILMGAADRRRLEWMGAQARQKIGDYSINQAVIRLSTAVNGVLQAA